MKRNVKNLTLVTLVFVLAIYVYMKLTVYLYEVEYSDLFKTKNTFVEKKLTLFSDCYCQKDLVHVERLDNYYEITIESSVEKNETQANFYNSYRLDKKEFEELFFTCDLYSVLRRGPFQKVLSYTLDENDSGYFFNNIEEKMNAAYIRYPKWVLRFYHLDTISHSYKCESVCKKHLDDFYYDNIDFCNINKLPFKLLSKWDASYMDKELWRLLALGDDFVNVFISQSTDTCIGDQKIRQDLEWLKSNVVSQLILNKLNEQDETLVRLSGFKNVKNRRLARKLFSILTDKYLSNGYWSDNKMIFEQFILPVLEKNYSIQLPSQHKCVFK
jgi:hypothetical protein